MTLKLKASSSWKNVVEVKLKAGGVWKNVTQGKLKVGGVWKTFFISGAVSEPASTVTISQATNSTTKLVTLTGTNKHWSPTPSNLEYDFLWYDGTSWVSIDNGTITNPSSGSTNTKTYTILNSTNQIIPNASNQYKFVVTSTYSGNTNASTSSATTVETPRNISDLSAVKSSSSPQSQINLSWSASLYANNYKIYKKIGSGDYSYLLTTANTTYTDTGTAGSTYTYKVLPITGNADYAGYTGNYSNESSATLDQALKPGLPSISSVTATTNTISFNTVTFGENTTAVLLEWSSTSDFLSGGSSAISVSGNSYTSYAGAVVHSTLYYWRIRGYNTAYGFGDAVTGTVTTQTPVVIPTLISSPSITPTSGYFDATTFTCSTGSWNGNPTSYTYSWKYLTTGGWQSYGVTTSTWTPPSSLKNIFGFLYTISCTVVASNSAGSSSAEFSSNSPSLSDATPSIPTSLTASTDRTDGINLTFSGSSNASSYDIFWNLTASGTPTSGATPDFPSVSSPYLWTGAPTGINRWFWVRGKNAYGTSSWYPTGDGVLGLRTSVPTPPDFTPAPPDFTPVPPDFTPAPPYFPYFKGGKGPGCIYADTRVLTVNGYVAARDIVVGDKLATLSPAGLTGDTILNASTDLAVALVDVEVLSVEHSVKDVVGFNNAPALYSAAQPIIIDVDGKFAYTRVGDIAVGDTIVSVDVNSGLISNTLVESIQTQSSQDVYDIRTTPYQWYITEDNIVIS